MPQVRFLDVGTLRTAARIRVMDTGVLQTVQRVRTMVSGVLQTVYQFFNVSATPSTLNKGSSSFVVTTTGCAVTVTGGVAPYTYAWNLISDDGVASWMANSPTSAVTTFSASGMSTGDISYASFSCDVTDSATNMQTTNLVNVTAYKY